MLAVRRVRRVDPCADGIGEIDLPRDKVPVVEDDLEVNMRRAPRVPARVDGVEAYHPVSIGELRSAQECLALGGASFLACITGIDAESVAVPDIDADFVERPASAGVDHLERERERRARSSFGDCRAHKLGIEIERTLGGFGRENADFTVRLCRSGRTRLRISGAPAENRRARGGSASQDLPPC